MGLCGSDSETDGRPDLEASVSNIPQKEERPSWVIESGADNQSR